MHSVQFPGLALVAVAACLGAPGASWAATPADGAAEAAPPTVLITADRSASGLAMGVPGRDLDTPQAITSVTMPVMQDQGGLTLQDALRNVPGAQTDFGFTGSHSQVFVLRGFPADSGTGASRILRDGARLSNYAFVPAFVEQVDVLRGAGAAIGTRAEPGGTVNVVTKAPELHDFGAIGVEIGENNAREAYADLNRVISAPDELAVRLVANHSAADQWRHVPDKLDGAKLAIAKGRGDLYHLRVGVEATNQIYQPDFGVPALNGRPAAIPLDRQLAENWQNSLTTNRLYDLHGDVRVLPDVTLSLDYTHMDEWTRSIRQSVSTQVAGTAGTFNRVTAVEPDGRRGIDSVALSLQAVRATGPLTHHLYAGFEYYREDLTLDSASVANPAINIFNPVYGRVTVPASFKFSRTTENLESQILSLQDRADIGDWSVIAGLQYMWQDFLYGTVGTLPVHEQRASPKVGLLRRLTPDQTVYFTYSTGTAPNQSPSSTNQSLASRHSQQYEAGWKSQWLDGRFGSSVALYRLDQSNMLSSDLRTVYAYDKTLAGTGRADGVEFQVSGALTDALSVEAAYAYTYSRFLVNSDFAGKATPDVAKHSASLWGHYQWDAHWRTGLGLQAQSDRWANEANTTILPGYVRLDANQSYEMALGNGDQVRLQLNVRNLLDRRYYVAAHLHVDRYILPGEGRNVSVAATYRF
ncbi:iron complex outermembrane receptor protein [Nitrospirillum amazonense]|uniref:Iron complex outermembrane receptor protein n=1 Tax=Nitrospirillum amazonense TaxID=28077 RepID=A0A560FP76_9PROT|nr:TonB-dependent siderophore receptor [Nitrospirillum amazonense]TWB23402.1 iron complex outermembrane receptor protein [Nitrospirillum amazonense]